MEDELKYPDLDVVQFWKDNDEALKDNCFNPASPQVAFGIDVLNETVITELELPIHYWSNVPTDEMMEYRKRYNDKAEKILGKRILSEIPRPHLKFPPVKLHGVILEGTYSDKNHVSWLHSDIKDEIQLEKMLDGVPNKLAHLRDIILPDNWDSEKKRIFEETGETPDPYWYGRRVRGPVTLAMSIFGAENTIFLMYDEPELAHRFFDTIEDVIMGYVKLFEEEAGIDKIKKNKYAFRFNDDDCCLLTPELYEEFIYPLVKRIYDYTCPLGQGYCRYHHSDSAMGHILPILGRLSIDAVQLGPTVLVDQIRKYMPRTRIDGCISPMTLMSNDEEVIIKEVKRDCEMAKASGVKGLKIDAAGSVNYGTKLTSLRAAMYAIQKFGRY